MPGHNDWYQIEYNSELEDHNEFILKFNLSNPAQLMSFQKAADYTAHTIYQQHKNIFLALSGGLDSEFIANVLLRNQIPFTPVILAFKRTREHFYALHWCDLHGVKPLIVDMEDDQDEFLDFAKTIVNRYRIPVCSNIITCYLAELAKSHDSMLLHGDPILAKITNGFYDPVTDQFEVCWYEFLLELVYTTEHVSGFFFHTPELALAYATELDISLSDNQAKTKLYSNVAYRPKNWPPLVPITDLIKRKINLKNDKFGKYFNLTKEINCKWSKQELIEILTKDK